MDEHKNTEPTSSAAPSGEGADAAATTPSMIPPPSVSSTPSEPVIELACIESPALAPSIAETAAGSHIKSEPKLEPKLDPKPEPKPAANQAFTSATAFDEIMPRGSRRPSGRATGDMIVIPAIAARRSAPRFGRITLLAIAIVAAAGAGAVAGALGAVGVARLAPTTAVATVAPDQLQTLHGAIAQLRTEVAALKTSVDANNHNANAQFAKLTDRIEHAQAQAETAAAKPTKTSDALEHRPDQVAAKDVTGSITLPQTASAAPVPPPQMPQPAIVPGWVLRDVYRGNAILQGRMGAMVEVAPGDMLPGLGRIESIRRQDGRWIVLTSRGIITSMQ
jgi:hypothetical protein